MDGIAGRYLKELADAGLAEDTVVFFFGDNGSGMPRSKRWPYNSGLHVPLLVHVPAKFKHLAPAEYQPGGTSDRLVGFVDFAPTVLSLTGIKPPAWMQGRAFLGSFTTPAPNYIYGFRGRMDERYDLVRSVRNQRYLYIRNYLPHLVYGQFIDYMFQTPTTRVWKQLYDQGKLRPPQTFFWEPKPPEELYDLESDPDEVTNLAQSAEHRATLAELRQALRDHLLRTRDLGFLTEAEQHRRTAASTAYELGHDDAKYPIERILATAELASGLQPKAVPELQRALKDPDSAVRYWGAMGLLMRGAPAVEASRAHLRVALDDASPSVRIAATHALGKFGREADLPEALAILKSLAPPDKNGAYVSLLALGAIESLGPKAASLLDLVKSMPTKDPSAVERANGYVERLVADMTGQPTAGKAPARKRLNRKD